MLQKEDRLWLDPDFEMVSATENTIIARGAPGAGLFDVVHSNLNGLATILDLVNGKRNVGEICKALADSYPESEIQALLDHLHNAGWLNVCGDPESHPSGDSPLIRVLGAHELGKAISSGLKVRPDTRTELVISPLPTVTERDATRRRIARYPREIEDSEANDNSAQLLAQRELVRICGEADLIVCALENVPYRAICDLEHICIEVQVPCLFVTYERGRAFVGPMLVPGRTAAFLSARLALMGQRAGADQTNDLANLDLFTAQVLDSETEGGRQLLQAVTVSVLTEVDRNFSEVSVPELFTSVLVVEKNGSRHIELPPAVVPKPHSETEPNNDLTVSADIAVARFANLKARSPDPLPTSYRKIGIIGGGTAGYLTALALRRRLPELEVTLVDSSKIPIIGVGEATTALLVHFLHKHLGLDIVDFYARVRPTWKLGIRFEWGPPGPYFYNSPFQFGRILEALIHEGDLNRNCLASRLMTANRTSIIRGVDGKYHSLLSEVPYAYHLDNERFVRYLRNEADRAGVHRLDCVVQDAVAMPNRDAIDYLATDDGQKLSFDLYVDCTGFRSLLLGKALGSPFVDFQSSLLCDTAVFADVPNEGVLRPYTTAETMDHGWCWNIPLEDADHKGYVFASAFSSVDQSVQEMQRKYPNMDDPKTIKFRPGRHEHFWKGNVVSIGNAYGFVEPLQSTAIHMIIVQIQKMIETFPTEVGTSAFQPIVNRRIGDIWDYLRWFLAAHYRYNDKLDTPFWKECRSGVDVTGIQELIDVYKERAPIGSTPTRFVELDESTFGVFRHDLLFMGQQLPTSYVSPRESRESWLRTSMAVDRVVDRALDHRKALQLLVNRPEILRRHTQDLD